MLKNLEDTINKHCLIALSYFSVDNKPLKQTLLAGTVKSVDKEMGITLSLHTEQTSKPEITEAPEFILPANLSCWFTAPKGKFTTSNPEIKIENPDFLITWDIYQTKKPKDAKEEGEQQWWEWHPRTAPPQVN
jgi:hypothetical protein